MNISIKKDEIKSSKIYLFYNLIINGYTNNNNNILNLLSDISDIYKIVNLKRKEIIYFLYINRNKINQILYNNDFNINIEINENNRNLYYYFYLYLLINDNINIINYTFSIEYIKDIHNYQKNIEDYNNELKKIMLAKIIIDLINNYKGLDDFYEKKDVENILNNIENENKNIIKYNIVKLKELKLDYDENYLMEEKIDKIYIEIIKALFNNKKFEDYEYTFNILNQLDLESINIANIMKDELSNILNEDYIKQYIIRNISDIFNDKIINFYYLLFKYIFKNNIFIYQFPFLLKTKKIILKLINKKLPEFPSFKNNNNSYSINTNSKFKYKQEYFISRIIDSEYYFNKYFDYHILEPLYLILNYYKNYLFESKINDINIIENIIKSKGKNLDYHKYLKDYELSKKMNERFIIIKFLFEQKTLNNKKTEKEINKYKNLWKKLEKKLMKKNMKNWILIIKKYYPIV